MVNSDQNIRKFTLIQTIYENTKVKNLNISIVNKFNTNVKVKFKQILLKDQLGLIEKNILTELRVNKNNFIYC